MLQGPQEWLTGCKEISVCQTIIAHFEINIYKQLLYITTSTINKTEQYLCSLTDLPVHITRLYEAFLTNNGIANHTPSQMKMNNLSNQPTKG